MPPSAFSATIFFSLSTRLSFVFATKRVLRCISICLLFEHRPPFPIWKKNYLPPYNQYGSMVSSLDSVKCNLNEFEFVKQNDWVNSSCWFKRVFMSNFSRWLISIFSFFFASNMLQNTKKCRKAWEYYQRSCLNFFNIIYSLF